MINNRKKGFTLVELLGVIVILLLLATIVTPIFVSYIRNSKDSAYDTQINTIKQSAKSWASSKENIKFLPTKDGDCVEVKLERLKENGYVDYNLKNPETGELFSDDLSVIIRKDGKSLTYEVNDEGNLVCETGVVIDSEYPKWVLDSASPERVNKSDTANVVIESDRKIIYENLTREKIVVKVGGKTIDDANVDINCTNADILTCNLTITNLSEDGKLSLVIDKDTMQGEDGNFSKKQTIQPNIVVDNSGPIITYLGKSNTNKRDKYATSSDTVTIKFKAEDNVVISNLTANDIAVYVDGNPVNCTKTLTSTDSSGKIEYKLKLSNVTATGKLSIKIPANKIEDDLGNKNNEKIISPGITYDNIKPTISFNPDKRSQYLANINVLINAKDNETGIDDETLKYSFTKNPSGVSPSTKINNGAMVNKDGANKEIEVWYIVAKVCDLAGNCTDSNVIGGPYNLSRKGPEITISPANTSSYVKSVNVIINVTSTGIDLDESTFKYKKISGSETLTDDIEVDTTYQANKNITIKGATGSYYIMAEACDIQGNCSRKSSGPYLIDNTPPNITCSPSSNSDYEIGPKSVNVKIEDGQVSVKNNAKYKISTNKADTPGTGLTVFSNGKVDQSVSVSGDPSGKYYVVVKGCDSLDNCRIKSCGPLSVDGVKPTIDNITVSNGTATTTIRDDRALGGYKITTSTTTPTSGWTSASGTSKSVSYDATSGGTYYLHVKDAVGNTNYKQFTVSTHTVTYAVSPSGGGSFTTTSQTVIDGKDTSNSTLTINSGYEYDSISTGCSYNNGTVSVSNVTSNVTCTVNVKTSFTSITYESETCEKYAHKFTVPATGTYRLEVWGAQGGNASGYSHSGGVKGTGTGGKGGYAIGYKYLEKGAELYVVVGCQGDSRSVAANTSASSYYTGKLSNGGYNGGGTGVSRGAGDRIWVHGGGGGATHIGTLNAELRTYGSADSRLYIVAGGGGGGSYDTGGTGGSIGYARENTSAAAYDGGAGGGFSGGSTNVQGGGYGGIGGFGGTQAHGGGSTQANQDILGYTFSSYVGSFGQGGGSTQTNNAVGGGGGGLHGGAGTYYYNAGGGGSGYIGGVDYGKTSSGNREGNGKAKITWVGSGSTSSNVTATVNEVWNYYYGEAPIKFVAPKCGTYKLEVWGAQGGGAERYYQPDPNQAEKHESVAGGKGGYSVGYKKLAKSDTLYVVVGGSGSRPTDTTSNDYGLDGGYNGGGKAHGAYHGSGGGATHIGTFNSTLASHGNDTGLYIVAGGGGGSVIYTDGNSIGSNVGGAGGGASVSSGQTTSGIPGSFSGAGSFGQGVGGNSGGAAGGGGGYTGGVAGWDYNSGGGGSGYIGGVSNGSGSDIKSTTANQQSGHGYARITYYSTSC